jgi:hypothetical protein
MKNTMTTNKLFVSVFLFISIIIVFQVTDVWALENNSSHYYGGGEDFNAGNWAPPGLSSNLSMLYFNQDKLKGSDGKTVDVPNSFSVSGLSNSIRFMYTTETKFLDGNVGLYLAPALVTQYVSSSGRSGTEASLADINFGALLSHHWKTFNQFAGVDIYAPTGPYNEKDVCNIGMNYWAIAPVYAFTYMGDMESPIPGFEVSAKIMYFFRTTNSATQYTSGQDLAIDYLIGKRFGDKGQLGIGAAGHFQYQCTDDTNTNEPADFDGHKTKQFTIGPALQFWAGKGLFTLKTLFSAYDENHGDGYAVQIKYWFQW